MKHKLYRDYKVRGQPYVVWAGDTELYVCDSTGAIQGSHSFLSRTGGGDTEWLQNLKAATYGKFDAEIRAVFADILLRRET